MSLRLNLVQELVVTHTGYHHIMDQNSSKDPIVPISSVSPSANHLSYKTLGI